MALGEASLLESYLDPCWYQPTSLRAGSTIDPPFGILSNETDSLQTIAPADVLIDASKDLLHSLDFDSLDFDSESKRQPPSALDQVLESSPDLIRGQSLKGPPRRGMEKNASQRFKGKYEPQKDTKNVQEQSKRTCVPRSPGKEDPASIETRGMFECNETWCKRSFKRREHLKRHSNSHLNERRHICWVPECHRAFLRPDHLNAHKSVHSKQGGRNRYVASLDEKSPFYDPTYRGQLTSDGYPSYDMSS
ncbi:uncharacterized protein N7443_001810 [Penicillium atrosanguineum]|uniref:uncharacterized protein n=1 Tax=Penicillium atrosanguineum TaxID=1132637 RepID=UPI002391427C|nr:uncharacterized protein N7443_001810 [Penicillium atrosanguineum]KAJ5117847.1 regulatory protein brlA [Penicillium atrosanguineum]KAJ5309349.1 hypothetical protein N7443_001810 [Penicillium atrosanguineum]